MFPKSIENLNNKKIKNKFFCRIFTYDFNVVRNAGCACSRNTLKLTPILKKLIGVEPEPNLVVVL